MSLDPLELVERDGELSSAPLRNRFAVLTMCLLAALAGLHGNLNLLILLVPAGGFEPPTY